MENINYGNDEIVSDIDYGNDEIVSDVPPSKKVGSGEALLRGGAQGATLGFGDEASAGLSTLALTMTDPNYKFSDFGKNYDLSRDTIREQNKKAEEAHPAQYISGNIVGSLPGMIATGGSGAGLMGGARIGATAGLGYSNAEQAPDVAKDVAIGATLGAVGNKIGEGIGTGINYIKDKTVGKLGNYISEKVGESADNFIRGISPKVRDAFENDVQAFDETLPEGVDVPIKVFDDKLKELFTKYKIQPENLKPETPATFSEVMNDVYSAGKANIDTVMGKMSDRIVSNPLPIGLAGGLAGGFKGAATGLLAKSIYDAGPTVNSMLKPTVNKINEIVQKSLAGPIGNTLRGASPAVINNVLSQTSPEYRAAKREEDDQQ